MRGFLTTKPGFYTASVALSFAILASIFLGYMSYGDFIIKRDMDYKTAFNAHKKICTDATLVSDTNLHDMCFDKAVIIQKSPQMLAIRDVICQVMPCSYFGADTPDSLIKIGLSTLSDTSLKVIFITVALYIVLVFFGWIRPGSRDMPTIMLPIYSHHGSGLMPQYSKNSISAVPPYSTSPTFKCD